MTATSQLALALMSSTRNVQPLVDDDDDDDDVEVVAEDVNDERGNFSQNRCTDSVLRPHARSDRRVRYAF